MSSAPQSIEQDIAAPARRETVIMGNQSYLNTVLRLITAELYKIRRRTMSKVLSAVIIALTIAFFCVLSLGSLFVLSSPAATFLAPPCSTSIPAGTTCLNSSPTQKAQDQAKQTTLIAVSSPLRLPSSLGMVIQLTNLVGLILIIILAGTIVGGEYSVGTVRLMFTRGPTRTQFFLAKVGTIFICIALSIIVVALIGILTGTLLNFLTGINNNFSFFTGGWVLHSILKLIIAIFNLFMYSMIAICLATLGRATAAGVAGALIWWGLELVLGSIFLVLSSSSNSGPLGNFIHAIPNFFITNCIGALLQNQEHYISATAPTGSISDLQAIIVLTIYLAVFIGIAVWINQKRDITN